MTKFRWTRELIAERKEALRPVRLPMGAPEPSYETMAEYWERMRKQRAGRDREAKSVAAKAATLPRPRKPPSKRAEG